MHEWHGLLVYVRYYTMSNLYVLVGLPGAGKSTWASNFLLSETNNKRNYRIISSDNYRYNLYHDVRDQTHNAEVFEAMYRDMRKFISEGIDVVIDATNTTLKSRRKVINALGSDRNKVDEIIAVVIAPPIEKVIKQDRQREFSVGEEVINKFLYSFQFPQKFEGFDEIWLNGYEEDFFECPKYDVDASGALYHAMVYFNQKNPHHIYTLGEHCFRVATYYNCFDIGYTAGLLHDVGKLLTQQVDENGVAHYNGHDSVGTYYLASHPEVVPTCGNWDDFFETLFYVNYHMRAHRDFSGEKAESRYRKIFGDERYEKLMQFAEYDRIASGTYKGKED